MLLFRCDIKPGLLLWLGIGRHGYYLSLQPFFELAVPLRDRYVVDGIPQGTFSADDDEDFLGASDCGVDKVALEHYVVW